MMSAWEYVSFRSRELGINPIELRSARRLRRLVNARIVIARELQQEFHLTLREVATALGRVNHTTAWSWMKGGKRRKCPKI